MEAGQGQPKLIKESEPLAFIYSSSLTYRRIVNSFIFIHLLCKVKTCCPHSVKFYPMPARAKVAINLVTFCHYRDLKIATSTNKAVLMEQKLEKITRLSYLTSRS